MINKPTITRGESVLDKEASNWKGQRQEYTRLKLLGRLPVRGKRLRRRKSEPQAKCSVCLVVQTHF